MEYRLKYEMKNYRSSENICKLGFDDKYKIKYQKKRTKKKNPKSEMKEEK